MKSVISTTIIVITIRAHRDTSSDSALMPDAPASLLQAFLHHNETGTNKETGTYIYPPYRFSMNADADIQKSCSTNRSSWIDPSTSTLADSTYLPDMRKIGTACPDVLTTRKSLFYMHLSSLDVQFRASIPPGGWLKGSLGIQHA
ncbi:unnamed protein product [Calypogeia fissa]